MNYASDVCGSYIVHSSKNIERPGALFSDNGYSIGNCVPSSIILQLCNNVKISTIEIQNKEYLSSFIEKIKFSRLDNSKWESLGEYQAKPTRKKQTFDICSNSFTKILKIEFISYQGKHKLFTLNHLKVFGRTVLDQVLDERSLSKLMKEESTNLLTYFGTVPELENILENMVFMDRIIRGTKMFMRSYFSSIFYIALLGLIAFVIIRKIL